MIDSFMEAVGKLDGLSLLDRHRIHRTAKLFRRRIEAGEEPSESDWLVLFPFSAVRLLARKHLSWQPDVLHLDFEATWVGANARAAVELEAVAKAAAARDDLVSASRP